LQLTGLDTAPASALLMEQRRTALTPEVASQILSEAAGNALA